MSFFEDSAILILQQAGCFEEGNAPREGAGVAVGSGMSCTADLAKAGQLIGAGSTRKYAFCLSAAQRKDALADPALYLTPMCA